MAIVQTQWERLSRCLDERLQSSKLTLREISVKSHVNYYAVRRMKRGGLFRRTKNALRLCSFFGLSAQEQRAQEKSLASVVQELKATWDGTEAHSQLLAELIRSTRNFKVTRTESATIDRNRQPQVLRKTGTGARK